MTIKSQLLCGASMLGATIVSGLIITGAHAADATANAAASSDTTVGELVVVAEKREEKIETVPVAISAFGAKERELIGIKTVQDLSDFTPGLSYYAIADRAYIRGVGRNTVNLATASGVATYYNGVYYGANATIALQHDSLFIGNVEVDRGPQNTLHGSNADGGTINYVSQKPTHDFYAEARVGVQDYGYEYGEAVVSGPLGDNFRFRIGGNYSNQSGGYFHNLDGKPEGGSLPQGNGGTSYYAEAQLEANIGDHLDAWAMASTGDYNTNFHTVATVGAIPEYEFGGGSLAPTTFFGLCAFDNNMGVGCNPDPVTGSPFGGPSPTGTPGSVVVGSAHGAPILANQFPGNNPSTANPHDFIETSIQSNDQKNDVALATTWTYHFPTMDLEYIGGYQSFHYNLQFGPGLDSGLTSYQIQGPPGFGNLTVDPAGIHTSFLETDAYFSHELTLTSTGAGPLQWLGGLYWYHEHFDQPIGLGCYPFQTQIINPVNAAGAAPTNPDGCTINVDGNMQYDDYAGFGHFDYKFNEQWKLQGGVRYTEDHKYGFEQQRLVTLGLVDIPGVVCLTAACLGAFTPGFDVTASIDGGAIGVSGPGFSGATIDNATGYIVRPLNASWGAWTGDATLNWTPDSETLAYARYARGYKSGGFNAGSISPVPETQPEYVDSFELGVKKTFGNKFTFNGDVFYYNYQNDQQPFAVAIPGQTATLSTIFNIPTARTYGVELESTWKPIDPLTILFEYSYLNATVTNMKGVCIEDSDDPLATLPGAKTTGCASQFTATAHPENLTGEILPESPANKVAVNGQYAFNFDPGTLTLSASYIWKDKTYGSIFNRPDALAPAYSTVNLRATFDDAKKRYTLSAFVNNVFNTIGYDNVTETNLSIAGSPLSEVSAKGIVAPLTFGGEIQVRFR